MTDTPQNLIQPADLSAWRAWLQAHHTRNEGVWLITWKKVSGRTRIAYGDAVEEALCFGWIANARRPETRVKRVGETAQRAARNERANQWRPANQGDCHQKESPLISSGLSQSERRLACQRGLVRAARAKR